MPSRLFLVTPRVLDLATFPAALKEALAGADVASLLVACEAASDMAFQRIAEVITPIAQAAGAAVVVADDTRAAGRARADGVQVTKGLAELKSAIAGFHPNRIVGASMLKTRHDAMQAAEAGVDYVFFGRVDRDEEAAPAERDIDLAGWWAPLFETPSVVLAGADPASLDVASETGAEFVALRRAIWEHPAGPRAAVAAAAEVLARVAPAGEAA